MRNTFLNNSNLTQRAWYRIYSTQSLLGSCWTLFTNIRTDTGIQMSLSQGGFLPITTCSALMVELEG